MKKILTSKNIIVILIISFVFTTWQVVEHYSEELAACHKASKYKNVYPVHPSTIPLTTIEMLDAVPLKNMEMGEKEMLKHKLIIVGITRDNAQDFSSMIRNLEYVGGFFADYRVMVFENDSKDGTKNALEAWKINNPKVDFISKDFHNKKRPSHKFLADARNYYIDAIKDKQYDDFDMVMMVDMDMGQGVDIRGVEDSFSKIDQWDAVCSNGVHSSNDYKMYDIFAFRSEEFPWSPKEWHQICYQNDSTNQWTKTCEQGKAYSRGFFRDLMVKWNGSDTYKLYWALIAPQEKIKYTAGSPLVPVHSCFGGMAFYKRQFIRDCRYDSLNNDCEHIAFHQCLREQNQGRMVMNPAQMIRYD